MAAAAADYRRSRWRLRSIAASVLAAKAPAAHCGELPRDGGDAAGRAHFELIEIMQTLTAPTALSQSNSRRASSLLLGAALLTILAALTGAVGYVLGLFPLVVAFALAAAAVPILAEPDYATALAIFIIWANLAVIAMHFHSTSPFMACSFAVLFVVPLLRDFVMLRKPPVINTVFLLMLVYFIVQSASAALSSNPADSYGRLASFAFEGVALYFIIINTVRTTAALRRAVWAILIAGALVGALSIYQQKTGNYYRTFGGLAQANHVDWET